MTPGLSTQIWKEKVVWGTYKGRCYGLGSQNDVRRLQSDLEEVSGTLKEIGVKWKEKMQGYDEKNLRLKALGPGALLGVRRQGSTFKEAFQAL
ncbi:hypothetical protein MTR67_051654 [Solanum verrucosum]|uniref:Uncharacterized protein n=1 Tax=Solanum verrucosum TaxID=315347 RepID=A0AAF0V6L0_SOLVR|nr:hypothetical protein MTR67_051654 [Solanum verrucosum]